MTIKFLVMTGLQQNSGNSMTMESIFIDLSIANILWDYYMIPSGGCACSGSRTGVSPQTAPFIYLT
jgi:hypothetical protein